MTWYYYGLIWFDRFPAFSMRTPAWTALLWWTDVNGEQPLLRKTSRLAGSRCESMSSQFWLNMLWHICVTIIIYIYMTIINNMFGGSCLYCSSSHPPRIIEDDPKWCGMDDLKLQTSQAGFLKAQPEHMSQLGEHLTWTIAKALSARIDHVVRKEARNRNKAVSVGASGFACNPNDEEQCRFVDLRDTMVWSLNIWIGRLATEWWNFDQEFLLIPRGNGICKSNNPDFRKSIFGFVLKMGYTPNYSHLVGIMISKTIGCRGLAYFQTHPFASRPLFVSMQSMSQTWIHQAATMTT